MEMKKLHADVKQLVRSQIRHGTFKNLDDTSDTDDMETDQPYSTDHEETDIRAEFDSETCTMQKLMKDLIISTRTEISKFDETLKGKRADNNLQQVTQLVLSQLKAAVEQIQQHAEIYEDIQTHNLPLRELYGMIESLTKFDIRLRGIQFRTEWKAYNLIVLSHILLILRDYKTAKDSSKYIIFWLQQNIGADAKSLSIHGFSSHILAIVHSIQKCHETASQYYNSALMAYTGHRDWNDLEAKEILISIASVKQEQAKRKINFTEATIGPEGGRMSINGCQVRFPEGALWGRKQFVLTTSLIEKFEEEYAPISAVLECEPATNFKSTVRIELPVWCEVNNEQVVAQVFCVSDDSSKRELIQNINLQNVQNEIMFDCKHFSSFFLMIKKSLFRKLKIKVAMNIWKCPEGNYIFILSVKDKTVERRWRNDLQEQGYGPTKAVLNPIVLKNKEELQITMTCNNGNFQPSGLRGFHPDFFHNQIHFQMFALAREDAMQDSGNTITCTVGTQKRLLEDVTWREMTTNRAQRRTRLADVFQDEIIKEFQSRSLWRRFALSQHGLILPSEDVNNIEANYPGNMERQKIAMLELWRDGRIGSESVLVMQIRNIVERFREHQKLL